MSSILAVASQKGGVAKTTTVVNLGAALAEQGDRVLVVDLDAQACATFSLGLDPEDLDTTASAVLFDNPADATVAQLLVSTPDGVDLLPAAIDLAGADRALADVRGREYVLRHALQGVRADLILLGYFLAVPLLLAPLFAHRFSARLWRTATVAWAPDRMSPSLLRLPARKARSPRL